jgi:hypothetical protein
MRLDFVYTIFPFFFAVIVVRLLLSIRRLLGPHWQDELAHWGGASKTDSA